MGPTIAHATNTLPSSQPKPASVPVPAPPRRCRRRRHSETRRAGQHHQQYARAVHQRDGAIVAAHCAADDDHLVESSRGRREIGGGRVEAHDPPEVDVEHARDHHQIERQARQRYRPLEHPVQRSGVNVLPSNTPRRRPSRPEDGRGHAVRRRTTPRRWSVPWRPSSRPAACSRRKQRAAHGANGRAPW